MGIWDRVKQGFGDLVDDLTLDDALRAQIDEAEAAIAAGELSRAEHVLEQITRARPQHAASWAMLGECQLKLGKSDLALAALERADTLEPGDFDTLMSLAYAQRAVGDDSRALDAARRALSCKVDEKALGELYGLLGEIYLDRGDIDRAVRELRKAVAASGGEDLELLGMLGRAHYLDGHTELARQALERAATRQPLEPMVAEVLAEVLLSLGHPDEARLAALRLVEARGDVTARVLLARCLIAAGRAAEARDALMRALDARPPAALAAQTHQLLAEVSLAAGDGGQALAQLRIAAELLGTTTPRLLRRQLVELALESDDETTLSRDAAALLAERADDGLGLAGAAMACRGESPEQALDLALRAVAAGQAFAGRLALGVMQLEKQRPREAQTALRAALRAKPHSGRARALLLRAYREQAAGSSGDDSSSERGFVASLRRLHGLLASRPVLEDLGPAVARVQADVDRPLLVAVMGEFNSGKSTFVNALIGEEIAPMGVRPTTATINVLKYGAERAARVIYRDDREETLAWDDVGPFLRGLDNVAARAVHVVELLYPAEELLRVNVVDTPGLNSMIDEHEQTAREYIEQADAIIWLFSAQQAGKDSEQAALELIERQKLKTVGVLNKVDHLSEQDLAQVIKHLEQGFGELCETIAAVAARPALDALTTGDEAALEKSRFPALRALLEERIFSRSRRIKREASRRKLAAVSAEARRRLETALAPVARARESIGALEEKLGAARAVDPREREREALGGALDRLYREASHEVLDFVRPRRWTFGQHRASRADRDFLIELLQERLVGLADDVVGRTRGELLVQSQALHSGLATELSGRTLGSLSHHAERVAALVSERRALLEQVAARFRAYVRGFLAGGRVDHFFEQQLPKLELELAPAERALREREVDVDLELLVPLAEWHAATTSALSAALSSVREVISVVELELDEAALAPLLELERSLLASDD